MLWHLSLALGAATCAFAATVQSANGLTTYQCPASLTPENAYEAVLPATSLSGFPLSSDTISVEYGEDGNRLTGQVYLNAVYNANQVNCPYVTTIGSSAPYTLLVPNQECRPITSDPVSTAGLTRRTAKLPLSKRERVFPMPMFNCPLEVSQVIYRRTVDTTNDAYNYFTGQLRSPLEGDCPAMLCASSYNRRRSMEDEAITQRQFSPRRVTPAGIRD